MRLKPDEIAEITGLVQPAAQARWFRLHFGVTVATDRSGPILTRSAFESMVAKRYGLGHQEAARPQVKLTRTA